MRGFVRRYLLPGMYVNSRTKHLRAFQDHFDYVLIAVILRRKPWIMVKVEDVHS